MLSIECLQLFCQKSSDHMCEGPSLDFLFYSNDPHAYHCTSIMWFLAQLPCNIAWRHGQWFPDVFLLLRMDFTILSLLLFQMKLHIALSNSIKNWVGILVRIALNLKIPLVRRPFLKCWSFLLYEELGWNFDGCCIESLDCFGKMDIFTMLILPIQEHGRSF